MEWVNEYIGIPYAYNGRSRKAFDCYGLVCDVYRDRLGIDLPDWQQDSPTLASGIEALCRNLESDAAKDICEEVSDPSEFDVIVVNRHGKAHHMGIFISGGVLHSAQGVGVVFEEYSRFLLVHPRSNVKVFRWRQ